MWGCCLYNDGMEHGKDFWPGYDAERAEGGEKEPSVDLRNESEVFRDHERLKNTEDETFLKMARDRLAEDVDGVMRISLDAYEYDFSTNPFVEHGPRAVKTYSIARYLDVTFLHRYICQNILVCGIRSREFTNERGRAKFIKRLLETGGDAVRDDDAKFDFLALKFVPYFTSDSTLELFDFYHKLSPHADERPQYPIDAWVIYDANSYEPIAKPRGDDPRIAYRLRPGFDRRQSVLGVAQIN